MTEEQELDDLPMISAICVSHSSRFGLLQRAILNFAKQRYASKELVIVVSEEGYLDQIQAYLRRPELFDIINPDMPLYRIHVHLQKFRQPADALSHAMAWASGKWIVAWDDDNLSHPDRLAWQLKQTSEDRPSFLAQSLYYFYDSDELFVTDYAQPSGPPAERCAVGSLMFCRQAYQPLDGQSRGVWTSAMLDKFLITRNYDLIAGDPLMFLVGSNGDNVRAMELHRRLGSGMPNTAGRDTLLAMEQTSALSESLRGYSWPHEQIDLCGKDAQACKIAGLPVWPSWLASVLPPADYKLGIPSKELSQRIQAEQQALRAAPPTPA